MPQSDRTMLTELENDVQRYLQLREKLKKDIDAEIEKIKFNSLELRDTTKSFIAHFDVFKDLSKEFRKHLNEDIKGASAEMAKVAAGGFSNLIHQKIDAVFNGLNQKIQEATTSTAGLSNTINEKISTASNRLNHSLQNATNTLEAVNRRNTKRNFFVVGLLCLTCLCTGFSVGYYYMQKHVAFSGQDLHVYRSGVTLHKIWPKLTREEKERIIKLSGDKD